MSTPARTKRALQSPGAPYRIGVVSDTHDYLDPQILKLFEGVDYILHAGDIGLPYLLLDLEEIAPVKAVLGNNDQGLEFKETEFVELGQRKFLIHHIVDPDNPAESVRGRIVRDNPDVVVFGHTHKPFCETRGTTLYFNPGYAGRPKGGIERSVAILHCDAEGITAEFLPL